MGQDQSSVFDPRQSPRRPTEGTTTRCCLRRVILSSAKAQQDAVQTSTSHTISRCHLITRSVRGRVSDCSVHRVGVPSIFVTAIRPSST